jgi:hypothetical protein
MRPPSAGALVGTGQTLAADRAAVSWNRSDGPLAPLGDRRTVAAAN